MTLTSLFSSLLQLVLKLISTSLLYPLSTFLTFVSAVIKFSKKVHLIAQFSTKNCLKRWLANASINGVQLTSTSPKPLV